VGAVPPSLRDDTRRHEKLVVMLNSRAKIATTRRSLRSNAISARVGDRVAYRPRPWPAACCSAAVSGPPVSASISLRSDARSSSLACLQCPGHVGANAGGPSVGHGPLRLLLALLLRAVEVYETERIDFAEAYPVACAESTGVGSAGCS
jgi:hypothetical protein